MAEPFNPSPLLRPGVILKAAKWENGAELAEKIATTDDADEMADLIEQAVDDKDTCLVVLMALALRVRGVTEPGTYFEYGGVRG